MIIIPDLHGRTFWKGAVKGRENEDIVFLGDYLDPYGDEGITYGQALQNLEAILGFRDKHPENVTLLIGNHDQQYFIPDCDPGGRYSWAYAKRYSKLFIDNRKKFLIAVERWFGNQKYIFSHAGFLDEWVALLDIRKGSLCDNLNNMYLSNNYALGGYLSCLSWSRHGFDPAGSCTWADVSEHVGGGPQKCVKGAYQIFGHTRVKEPIVADYFACLDTKRAFVLGQSGVITELDGKPVMKLEELKKKLEI